ncbi:CD109 antigen [Tribolium castaneum]|uniref:CD109 antigen-like Protein n=1 Tax=Tribolium castaneum TaxID=7070 RepID=D6WR12_TRICA|nr:PREDICTED: CD109 antigen [Tribolium castaneum]EFA07485.1 CD109 antigen-like Protein [Tribolium castaneum]|eukprot:XP_970922.1 PREDICTED: CD109 antigen [Tribolium castaneum]
MKFKFVSWSWIFLVVACATAQDININNPNQQPDLNNPYSTSSTPNYDLNNNPFTQEPNYNGDQFGNRDQFGQNQPYDPNNFPQRGQFDPNNPQRGQFDPNNPQRGQFDPNNPQGGQYNPDTGLYEPGGRGPPWRQGGFGYGQGRNEIDAAGSAIKEATYFLVASKTVRPGQLYRVAVTILQEDEPLTVRASITRNGVEMTEDHKRVKVGVPETLLMRVPPTSVPGEYKLRVEGLYDDILGGIYFVNETNLIFSQRSMTIFIQLDKPVYKQGEKVRFRTIPINTELKAFDQAIDVYMLDPNGHIMKRWLSKQSNLGTVSLDYELSDQPVFGEWRVRVIAQNQIEESTFLVEEYYQTRFEVNVTMPAFFLNTDEYLHGIVMANYTSGAPVRGNLTLKAIVRPIKPIDRYRLPHRNRNRNRNRDRYDNRGYNRFEDRNRYGPQRYDDFEYEYDEFERDKPIVEKYFNFDEQMPFWFKITNYYEPVPSLKYFYGVYEFKYPIRELLHYVTSLEGMEVVVVATVGERFLDEVIEGYSTARIFNSSIKLSFLGGSPQVYKPGMPVAAYIAASFHDGSSLPLERLTNGVMEVFTYVESGSGRRDLPSRQLFMVDGSPGVWEYKFDIKSELGLEGTKAFEDPTQRGSLRIQARFRDGLGHVAETELLMLSHYSPNNQHIKVFTSTLKPQVGANMIFHIKSNFFIRKFNYMIVAKGIVLVSSDQDMFDYISTMAVTLSAEMAPVATIIVWHLGQYGEVTVDSLTFPVNGISRNKFKVYINNKKARTGHKVEVAIYGEPGSYVGLSGIDRAFYTMQAGNELTYAKVLTKMASFDENINGTHEHIWFSHDGNPDDLVYFPSSTYGIDANRTFEYAGLVVFSDFELPRRWSRCNATLGWAECLNGACYRFDKRCDYFQDCTDGTDEAGCKYDNGTELAMFRKYRFNRIQRQYENVWVWKDVNIGPHGRYIFNVPVPARPVHWMVSAFSMSPSLGFGMLNKAIEYIGVLPFFINVEMPTMCMQGEQVGIRVSVFNYMMDAMEATVVLVGSRDYKFVHVEENGVVRAYNPRTSFGEHQFFIYIKPQDAAVVYIPIVPTRLGDIDVTVYASTLIGKDQVTRKLHVESDGLPQHRHQSMLLDLSNRAYAFQYMHVNVTETPIIPYEYDRYYVYGSNRARISVVGDVVGPIFPTMPVNATSILHLPMDSAEQNMFSFAANMYTTLYMRYTQQRNRTLEKLAFYYMNIGYQRQLSFMQPDGSFSLFRSDWNQSDSSVWLTAYCARIFQEASFYEWENYIYIDPAVIAKSVEWVLRHQNQDGAFYETTWLPDRKYNSSLNFNNDPIRHRNITLTAHVLIMLESVKDLTSGLSSKVAIAQRNAVHWLERNMDLIKERGRPFDVAIVAYALMKSKAAFAEAAYLELSRHRREEGGLLYWGRQSVPQPPYKIENQKPFSLPRLPYEYDSENIEATAYALMVYVARQEIFMNDIVRWLNTQRLTDGGWASTSDTANALKALIEYTSAQRIRDISSLSVTVEATALPGKTAVLHVNDKNRAKLQHIDIPNAWGTVKVQAKGTGYAILQMHVQYNVDIARFQTKPPVPAFDLWIRPYFYGRNMSHITLFSCQRWNHLGESPRSGLAVLDVTIPTGYIVQQQDLDAYILSRQVRNLQRARFSERKVLFYFNYLDYEETCINFTVERWYPVANMSRYLPIRIYDYYAPERFNETIFDALSTYNLDICHVCGSSQCPYCWIYNATTRVTIPLFTLIFTSIILIVRYFGVQDNII